MRLFTPRPGLAAWGTALALLGSLAACRPAAAQGVSDSDNTPNFTVRLGGYFATNTTVRHAVGSSFLCAGLDYAVQQSTAFQRTIVSLDYIDRSSGDNDVRVFPLTLGQLIFSSTSNGIQPYYGAGVGVYFTHEDLNSSSGTSRNSHDDAVFGGYFAAGVEFQRVVDLEARYHLVTSSNDINVGGLEVTAGYRF